MGSLQVKNNIYQTVIRCNGKNIWKSTGIKVETGNDKTNKMNRRKAEVILAERSAQFKKEPQVFNNVYFVDYIRKWLELDENYVEIVTHRSYTEYAEKHIIPYFEPLDLKLRDVRLSHIEEYFNYIAVSGRLDGTGGLSYSTIRKHKAVLNQIFKHAIRNELINKNPCNEARIPKAAKRKKRKISVYTPEECETLLKCTKGAVLHDMIKITFLLGLRKEELLGLKWSAVDFDNNIIKICHTVVLTTDGQIVRRDGTKTEESQREYPLTDDIRDMLLVRKARQEENRKYLGNCYIENDYVFVKDDGSTYYPSYPTQMLRKTIKRYDLPHICWHDLRHSCATMLITKYNWTMKDVSEWLGHSDISTTMNMYTHISIDHKREISVGLNGMFNA